MKETELKVISELRKDSRQRVTRIASKLGMPKHAAFSAFRTLQKAVKAYSVSVDFAKIGYSFRMNFIFSSAKREALELIMSNKNVDSVQRVGKSSFFVWGVFRSMAEAYEFKESLEKLGVRNIRLSHVLADISKESMPVI